MEGRKRKTLGDCMNTIHTRSSLHPPPSSASASFHSSSTVPTTKRINPSSLSSSFKTILDGTKTLANSGSDNNKENEDPLVSNPNSVQGSLASTRFRRFSSSNSRDKKSGSTNNKENDVPVVAEPVSATLRPFRQKASSSFLGIDKFGSKNNKENNKENNAVVFRKPTSAAAPSLASRPLRRQDLSAHLGTKPGSANNKANDVEVIIKSGSAVPFSLPYTPSRPRDSSSLSGASKSTDSSNKENDASFSNASMPTRRPESSPLSGITNNENIEPSSVYTRRKLPDTRRSKRKTNAEPFSCPPPLRMLSRRNEENIYPDIRGANSCKPPPKKKQRMHTLPQDFIEEQRAYFAEIDNFELQEEEVSSSDDEDISKG